MDQLRVIDPKLLTCTHNYDYKLFLQLLVVTDIKYKTIIFNSKPSKT